MSVKSPVCEKQQINDISNNSSQNQTAPGGKRDIIVEISGSDGTKTRTAENSGPVANSNLSQQNLSKGRPRFAIFWFKY